MSRSSRVDFRLPNAIRDAVELRRSRGEYGRYKTMGTLQTGLNLYLSLFPKAHDLTVAISEMTTEEQDDIHDFSLRLAQSGVLVESLTDEKPLTAKTLLALARRP